MAGAMNRWIGKKVVLSILVICILEIFQGAILELGEENSLTAYGESWGQ